MSFYEILTVVFLYEIMFPASVIHIPVAPSGALGIRETLRFTLVS
jgi:hypothetical protein